MRKLMVLCDLDSIVVNLTEPWLAAYNADYNDNVKPSDCVEWDTHLFTKCGEKMYDYLTPELFSSLKPLPGAFDAINLISQHHDVHFVTAAPTGCADAKIKWVKSYFPHLGRKVATIKDKWMVHGDVLIDDKDDNLVTWKKKWPEGKTVSISCPYNCKPEALPSIDFIAYDYTNTVRAWQDIIRYLSWLE